MKTLHPAAEKMETCTPGSPGHLLRELIRGQLVNISSRTIVVHGGTTAERTALIKEQLWQCSRTTNFLRVPIQPWFMADKEPFVRLYREAFGEPRSPEQIAEVDAVESLKAFFRDAKDHGDWHERLDGTKLGDRWNALTGHAQAAWRKDMQRPWVIVADGMEGYVPGRRAYNLNKLFSLVHSAGIAVTLIVACSTKWRKELPAIIRPRSSWVEVCLEATPAG